MAGETWKRDWRNLSPLGVGLPVCGEGRGGESSWAVLTYRKPLPGLWGSTPGGFQAKAGQPLVRGPLRSWARGPRVPANPRILQFPPPAPPSGSSAHRLLPFPRNPFSSSEQAPRMLLVWRSGDERAALPRLGYELLGRGPLPLLSPLFSGLCTPHPFLLPSRAAQELWGRGCSPGPEDSPPLARTRPHLPPRAWPKRNRAFSSSQFGLCEKAGTAGLPASCLPRPGLVGHDGCYSPSSSVFE